MQISARHFSDEEAASLLRARGIGITAQRVAITRLIFERSTHLSADEVFQLVNQGSQHVSKATVYNTLGTLAGAGVIREVIADPDRVFYDPNTAPHHHFYDTSTGALTDIPAHDIKLTGLPAMPPESELEGIDVIIRLRPRT